MYCNLVGVYTTKYGVYTTKYGVYMTGMEEMEEVSTTDISHYDDTSYSRDDITR